LNKHDGVYSYLFPVRKWKNLQLLSRSWLCEGVSITQRNNSAVLGFAHAYLLAVENSVAKRLTSDEAFFKKIFTIARGH